MGRSTNLSEGTAGAGHALGKTKSLSRPTQSRAFQALEAAGDLTCRLKPTSEAAVRALKAVLALLSAMAVDIARSADNFELILLRLTGGLLCDPL